jgi:hypothetical protein
MDEVGKMPARVIRELITPFSDHHPPFGWPAAPQARGKRVRFARV